MAISSLVATVIFIIILIPVIPVTIMIVAFIQKKKNERTDNKIVNAFYDYIGVVESDTTPSEPLSPSTSLSPNYPPEMYGNSLIFLEQEKNQVQYPRVYRNIYAPDKIGHEIALQSKFTTNRRYTDVEQ